MITPLLKLALQPIVERRRQVRLFLSLAAVWGTIAVLAFAWSFGKPAAFSSLLLAFAGAALALFFWKRSARWEPDYRAIARLVERRHPELHALLVTAIEQQPQPGATGLNFLQERVVQQAVAESRRHSWIKAAPRSRWFGALALQGVLLFAFAFALARLESASRGAAHRAALAENGPEITPGDAQLERGAGLIVLAKFASDLPSEATLVLQPQNEPAQRIPLVRNLDDPVFGGAIPEVNTDLVYRIEYAGRATRDFRVSVFEHPRLERADARVSFPDYTGLPEKQIADTRRISAVEGSQLGLDFQLNKPVKSARLVGKDQSIIPLEVDTRKPLASLRDYPLKAGQTYELQLEDADGRASKLAEPFTFDVLPNRRPELKFVAPKGDQSVTALQEIPFRAEAWDDFGMPTYGLSYTVAAQPAKELVLGRDARADERVLLAHLLKLEDSKVKTNELVSWFLWADDVGPDGKVRRTSSDLFFAEVRPFEEIFRAGQASEGQQQPGQANAAKEQAASQKKILIATWNLQRREAWQDGAAVSDAYLKDIPVLRDAQQEAIESATKLQQKLENAESRELMEKALSEMKVSLEQLTAALPSPAPLPVALRSEQAAYDALLKLASHEFEITKSQSGQGEEGGEQNQAELDQLELTEEKNRYETTREAQPMGNPEQREQLAVLNRLKELAQRQGDINERLKEMQTALQAAQTEKEKEELKRQLKRLREEEQQLLSDLDEAQQKMAQSPAAPQLAEERKQLEESREQAQQSAQAMAENSPAQALAAGTRAQRELQELRDDFRKKTSGQFNDALREMRNDARALAEQQEELGQKLAEPDQPARPTLDAASPREQLRKQFEEQQKGLANLREGMRGVSERADAAEPLLAKELYDSLRKSSQANTEESLERAAQLAARGFAPQAKKLEAKAREEINDLKAGVERAAESVLGDEAEALRTARAELDALARAVDKEIARANPALAKSGEAVGKENENSAATAAEKADGQSPNASAPGEQGTPAASPDGSQKGQDSPDPAAATSENGQPGKAPGQSENEGGKSGEQGSQQASGAAGKPGATPGTGEGGSENSDRANRLGNSPRSESPLRALAQQPEPRGSSPESGEAGGSDQGGGLESAEGPLRGDGFVEWSDRLRNVEEMLDQPTTRNEVAQVREAARSVRAEFKKHGADPQWDLVKAKISAPLAQLRDRLGEELARRDSKEALVPIDRDPVPPKYTEHVRRYYEELGRSR